MLEWFQVLKGLVKANIKTVIQFKTNTKVNSKKNSDNKASSITANIGGNVNIFNIQTNDQGLVDENTLKQLREAILPSFEDNNLITLKDESRKLLRSYKDFLGGSEIAELLSFFEGKISQLDLRLLETGLYESHLLANRQQEKAQRIKGDVIKRYGQRGKNIINLASGGFFQTHIKPLYEALEAEGLTDSFKDEYELILREMPFAIFVHGGVTGKDALEMLYEKADKNRMYGVREETIILNGFGSNADTIEKLIPTLNKKYKRVAPKVTYLGKLKSIQVSVYYRETNK